MKKSTTLITLLFFVSAFSQTYVSEKQSFVFLEKETDYEKIFNEKRIFIIDKNTYTIEMPDNKTITGKFKKVKLEKTNDNKYEMEEGGFFQITNEKICMNLYSTDYKCIVNFYIGNGYEIETKRRAKDLIESSYQSHKKLFGDFTAQCIKEKKVKIGMKGIAIVLILGQPNEINETETENDISKQWVYENLYIYTDNGIVTVIQKTY